ncbi:NAD(P)-dependent oxidoreductase [Henriciella sp. AS95]|uniref:NAD(P)-dependent oxidoreductase n=1 Tax=Henriciella sp. AS95 TaxID=3135782 RepID=UPI0031732341
MTAALRIGYIGLGDIGAPMAERIAAAGWPLSVWNRTPEKMQPLLAAGAQAASSPAEIAETCDVIFTCLGSVSAMHDVMSGECGLLRASPSKARLLVDNSTVPPADAMNLASQLADASIHYVDAPVSGGAIGARAGTLAVMVGGDRQDVALAKPVLQSFASKITHLGPVGSGQAMKACNQVLNFGTMAALAEAVTLGRRYGLAPNMIVDAVAGGFAESNVSREFGRSLDADDASPIRLLVETLDDYYRGTVRKDLAGNLDILMKDLAMALDMARTRGVPLPVISHFDSVFRMIQHLET